MTLKKISIRGALGLLAVALCAAAAGFDAYRAISPGAVNTDDGTAAMWAAAPAAAPTGTIVPAALDESGRAVVAGVRLPPDARVVDLDGLAVEGARVLYEPPGSTTTAGASIVEVPGSPGKMVEVRVGG